MVQYCKNYLQLSAGVEVGGVGGDTHVFFAGVHYVNMAPCICGLGKGGDRDGQYCSS